MLGFCSLEALRATDGGEREEVRVWVRWVGVLGLGMDGNWEENVGGGGGFSKVPLGSSKNGLKDGSEDAEGRGFADGPSFRRLRPRRFPLHAHDGCRTRDSRLVPFKHDESTL